MDLARYFIDVLGVKEILIPNSALMAEQTLDSVSMLEPILWVIDEPSTPSLSKNSQFLRMMEAIGINLEQVKVLEYRPDEFQVLGLGDLAGHETILSFSPLLSQLVSEKHRTINLVTTFGPRDLATNDQLKRQTWKDLQGLMKKLGLETRPRS